MTYILVIDSGNSFIKWGLHNKKGWKCQEKLKHEDSPFLAERWKNLPDLEYIIISNVAGEEARHNLTKLLTPCRINPFWISSVGYQCGVRNLYANPIQLGSDRWAALLAAWNLQFQTSLVINIGTAMTVDLLTDSGCFVGGIIIPGPDLMFKVLKTHCAIAETNLGHFKQLPDSTADAIFTGVVQSLIGAIERMKEVSRMRFGNPVQCIFLSGGASSLVSPHLGIQVRVVNNLVLEGLLLIAYEHLNHAN